MGKLALMGGEPVRKRLFTSWPQFDQVEVDNLRKVLESRRWFSGMMGSEPGTSVWEFEQRFASLHGVRYASAVANGSAALEVSLRSLGVGEKDEVIIPAYTFVATATAILQVGATPVVVDIEPETLCIDPVRIKEAITKRTKAVIPVHFAGQIASMPEIMQIAREHDLKVIEDAAHASGAKRFGKRAGSFGDTGCFSFQESKVMTSGEGGIITTANKKIWEETRSLRSCGRDEKRPWYEHFNLGWNYRLSEFQAAVLLAQLERLEDQIEKREENARYLTERLSEIPGVSHPRDFSSRTEHHSYYYYVLLYQSEEFDQVPRDLFVKALRAEGIPAEVTYIPIPDVPMFKQGTYPLKDMGCRNTKKIASKIVVFMHQVLLGTREDLNDIVAAIIKVRENIDELESLS
jgi:3-amino-5-hydroxybenzoate synthase